MVVLHQLKVKIAHFQLPPHLKNMCVFKFPNFYPNICKTPCSLEPLGAHNIVEQEEIKLRNEKNEWFTIAAFVVFYSTTATPMTQGVLPE